jgi:hypothetical protein
LNISEGSVGNIVRAHRKYEQEQQSQISPKPSLTNATISTGIEVQEASSGVGSKPVTTENTNPSPKPICVGGPLVSFLNKDNMTIPSDVHTKTSEAEETSDRYQLTPDSEDNGSVEDRLKQEQERNQWSYYGPAWMGVLRQITREKDQRHHELLVIDRRKQRLQEWERRLEQRESDLKDRETQVQPFLDLARQLQGIGVGFETAISWIETIKEKAEVEKIDQKTAAICITQELRSYRQFVGIQKKILEANQELALVNMSCMKKQQALTVLTDLLNRGVTESQIVQLINFAGEWNDYWTTTNGNLQQPVNGSSNPGSSGSNFSRNNGYGGNFSVNDLIRLNLLKSTTTNLLKSVRSPPGL